MIVEVDIELAVELLVYQVEPDEAQIGECLDVYHVTFLCLLFLNTVTRIRAMGLSFSYDNQRPHTFVSAIELSRSVDHSVALTRRVILTPGIGNDPVAALTLETNCRAVAGLELHHLPGFISTHELGG